MMIAQIKFGLALADDLRRIRKANVLPGEAIKINSSVEAIVKLQRKMAFAGPHGN